MLKLKLILGLCSLYCLGFSQKLEPKQIAEKLCSPEFHGRGYVDGGDSIAARFLAKEFYNYGLKPLKNDTYYQSFEFPVNTFPGKMEVILNNTTLRPGIDYIIDSRSGSFSGNLEYEYVGKEVFEDEDKFGALLAELRSSDSKNTAIILSTKGLSDDLKRMAKQFGEGLNDYFPVIELYDSKFTWSVSQQDAKYPYILLRDSLWLQDNTVKIAVDNQFVNRHKTQNVIGYVPAKCRFRKKYIFITAHYDHLGRMGAETYFPGANDNASGTSILFGLADKFLKNPSKYNIVFIAFAGEEAGLLGSKYYTENPLVPLDKIKFLINLDIMGSGEDGVTIVNGSVFTQEFDQLVALNEKEQLLTKINSRGKAANSDHYFFTEKGVPSFFMYTMGPNKNYHDIDDKFESLSFAEFEDLQKIIEQFVRSL